MNELEKKGFLAEIAKRYPTQISHKVTETQVRATGGRFVCDLPRNSNP
jgi:hypothetical protein